MQDQIIVKGARLHNLKNVTLAVPKNKLVVLTGLSGSGKSTLAFDTLHKEGQRQYMESLGMVTDYVSKPKVDAIVGLSPSISVDQHLTNHSPRSTVGTATEVFTYLRVLLARLGHRPCPKCGADVPPSQDVSETDAWEDEGSEGEVESAEPTADTYPCPHCGTPVPELGMANFSFNKPAGACPTCTGLGTIHTANLKLLLDETLSVSGGGILKWDKYEIARYQKALQAAASHFGFSFDPDQPIKELDPTQRGLLLYGVNDPHFLRRFPGIEPPTTAATGRFEGVVTNLLRRYAEHIHDVDYRDKMEKLLITQVCPDCQGERLRLESRQVTVAGRTLVELSRMPLNDLARWLAQLPNAISPEEQIITEPIIEDLRERIRRLLDIGVGYLTMDRAAPTLSAGEAQRLRLAALLGSGLTGVLYVLDEPTIGLHPRDTRRLIQVMRQLRDLGNTVLVIEHDPEVMIAADYLIDMGPGAGERGGEVVAAGSPDTVAATDSSVTGQYLSGKRSVPVPPARRHPNGKMLTIRGAREHNLKGITVDLPLGTFIAVTGVSGSGKSTLMFDILDRAGRQHFYSAAERPGKHSWIEGWEHLHRLITINQVPIGRTPRSNAATYTDVFTAIRQTFADVPAARARGLTPGHFSFNVPGGRCERCQGAGVLTVSMHFLPDVQVRCPACHGRRFRREVLGITYHGVNIADVLEMTVEEALPRFEEVAAVSSKLALLSDVGLGYLKLGQPATTLSGGEAQRVKLAKELAHPNGGQTLYLLDEPTTGLHQADTARLLGVLQRLVDAGNTVAVIEHNLDVIRAADWVIDLGPEGGEAGGELIAVGTPEQIASTLNSQTGQFLRQVL